MLGTAAAIFSVLLIATGIVKVRKPRDVARAIRSLGIPAPDATGRLIGFLEVIVGLAALINGSTSIWLAQTGLYGAFLAWVLLALRRDAPMASCGCLGTPDTPPYWGHAIVDSVGVVASLGAALSGSRLDFVGVGPAIAQTLIVIVGAWLAWAVIGDGARLHGAVHP